MDFANTLSQLSAQGNLRRIPEDIPEGAIDLSSNDYLGLASDTELRQELLEYALEHNLPITSSASRLLATKQKEYAKLEDILSQLYVGRRALLFNSGYHANTGIIGAIADKHTLIVADRLVHASIIDGARLSGADFVRFSHNDYEKLRRIIAEKGKDYSNVLIISEGVFSMDGDSCSVEDLVEAKNLHPGALLYIDEAHSFGVVGPSGLGVVEASGLVDKVDIVVGTFGKALASVGAFSIVSPTLREYLVNRARSLIFSTAIPPVNIAWTRLLIERMVRMDSARARLRELAKRLSEILSNNAPSHIQPFIVGNPGTAIAWSTALRENGVIVLPIRIPTVPPGTDRLRFSLSAALTAADLDTVEKAFLKCKQNF